MTTDYLNNLLTSDGYSQGTSFESWLQGSTTPTGEPVVSTKYVMSTIATWIPARTAVAAIPAIPQTPAQISYTLNLGWNTSARSVDPIAKGGFIEYSVNAGASGVIIGLGVKGKDGDSISSFSHALLSDSTGVWSFESGVKVSKLKSSFKSVSKLRIVRQDNNKIIYMIITDSESLAFVSGKLATNAILYGYGHLHSSGDVVNSAGLESGEVQFGRV